jgi:hypothetical protein
LIIAEVGENCNHGIHARVRILPLHDIRVGLVKSRDCDSQKYGISRFFKIFFLNILKQYFLNFWYQNDKKITIKTTNSKLLKKIKKSWKTQFNHNVKWCLCRASKH